MPALNPIASGSDPAGVSPGGPIHSRPAHTDGSAVSFRTSGAPDFFDIDGQQFSLANTRPTGWQWGSSIMFDLRRGEPLHDPRGDSADGLGAAGSFHGGLGSGGGQRDHG